MINKATGLRIDPSNESLNAGLREVEATADPEFLQLMAGVAQVVATNPQLQEYQRQDPSYTMNLCRVIAGFKSNPQSIQHVLMDPNPAIREGIMAYMGIAAEMNKREPSPERPQKKEPEKTEPKEEPLSEEQKVSRAYTV